MIPKNPPMQAGFSAFSFLSTEAFRYYSLLTRCQLSANLPDEVDHEAGDGKKEGGTKSDVEHRTGRACGDSGSGGECAGADAIDGFEGSSSHLWGGLEDHPKPEKAWTRPTLFPTIFFVKSFRIIGSDPHHPGSHQKPFVRRDIKTRFAIHS